MFKIDGEPESPNEGACLRSMMNPNRRMRVVFIRFIMNWNRQMTGQFKIYDEPESPNDGP